MNNANKFFKYLLFNRFFWKEFLYSLLINIIVSAAFISILYYSKNRSVWDALSIISLIILLISFLTYIYSFKKTSGPIKKVKKLFVIKENENLKLTKTEKAFMNILDDDLKSKKDTDELKKINNAWLSFYSILISTIALITSTIVLFA